MACPNCSLFLDRCKAECCSFAPIPLDTVLKNTDKFQQQPLSMPEVGDGWVIPVTGNGKCVFLQPDSKCAIYDQRPDICQKFGDESHQHLTCAHQRKDGSARDRAERRRLDKTQRENTAKLLNKGLRSL